MAERNKTNLDISKEADGMTQRVEVAEFTEAQLEKARELEADLSRS